MVSLSPSVNYTETDISVRVASLASSIGAIVGHSQRGPLTKTLIHDTESFIATYGPPTPGDYLHYCSLGFLRRSNQLWVRRAINAASPPLYGGVVIKAAPGAANVPLAVGVANPNTVGDGQPGSYVWGLNEIMLILAPNPGAWNNNCTVKITNISASDFEFDIEFYEKDAGGTPRLVHRRRVSRKGRLTGKKDGYGRNMYVGDVFGVGDTNYFIVVDNTAEDTLMPLPQAAYLSLAGGTDDSGALANDDVKLAWGDFENPEDVTVNILINGGYAFEADADIGKEMDRIAQARQDCVAVLDTPFDLSSSALVTWRTTTLGLNSSYSALYAPWLKVYDPYNDKDVWIPPSGHIAGVYALTDYVTEPWFAPAGKNRGMIVAKELSKNFPKGERDTLYPAGINPIRKLQAGGNAVWGQRNLQTKESRTNRINVRRLLITVQGSLTTALEDFQFEQNDYATRLQIEMAATAFLRDIQRRRGLYDFAVVCDERNNTPDVIDSQEIRADFYLKPTAVGEFMRARSVVTPTGVSFEEAIGLVQSLPAV